MPRRGGERRSGRAGAVFLAVWMTFWLAAILIAVWTMGGAALSGEPGAAIVLLIWIAVALFGLVSAGRSLRAVVLGERRVRPTYRNHRWNDGLDADPARGPTPPDVPPPPPADAPPAAPPPERRS